MVKPCVVVAPGGLHIYRTRDYREKDADETPPAMQALREAQEWTRQQGLAPTPPKDNE